MLDFFNCLIILMIAVKIFINLIIKDPKEIIGFFTKPKFFFQLQFTNEHTNCITT